MIFIQNGGAGLIRISWLGPSVSSAMSADRKADGDRRRQRVVKAISAAAQKGNRITVSGIARQAGVDRTFVYRHRDLLALVHAAELEPAERNPASGASAVSRASLQADLANAQARTVRPTAIRCRGRQRPRPAPPASVPYPRSAAPLAVDAFADASSISEVGSVVPGHGLRQLVAVPQHLRERTMPATWPAIPCRLRDQSVARQPRPRTAHPWSRNPSSWSKALA